MYPSSYYRFRGIAPAASATADAADSLPRFAERATGADAAPSDAHATADAAGYDAAHWTDFLPSDNNMDAMPAPPSAYSAAQRAHITKLAAAEAAAAAPAAAAASKSATASSAAAGAHTTAPAAAAPINGDPFAAADAAIREALRTV